MKKNPGKFIEEKRKLMKLSKRELSALSNISHTEVGRIESGERENPNPKTLRAIADILDINYLELFFQFGYIGEDLVRCSEIDKYKENPGSYVKEKRECLGISQRELGKLTNCSHSQISRIEENETGLPGANILRNIANALGLNYLYLYYLYGYVDKELLEGTVVVNYSKELKNYTKKELLEELLQREM